MRDNNGEDKPYPTDEIGRPDGRNYHYRIPLNDYRAVRLATWALHDRVAYKNRLVSKWDGFSGDELSYMGIQTHDNKGHLKGLAEYSHSAKWQDGPRFTDVDEYRGVSGGTKVKGTFKYTENHCTRTLEFETAVGLTPKEFEKAAEEMGEEWRKVQDAIQWAKDEAIEQFQEAKMEFQRECEHPWRLEETTHPDAEFYCEKCEAEVTSDGETVPPMY